MIDTNRCNCLSAALTDWMHAPYQSGQISGQFFISSDQCGQFSSPSINFTFERQQNLQQIIIHNDLQQICSVLLFFRSCNLQGWQSLFVWKLSALISLYQKHPLTSNAANGLRTALVAWPSSVLPQALSFMPSIFCLLSFILSYGLQTALVPCPSAAQSQALSFMSCVF